jgi:5-methylcytosine-specific restriction endonuclease McrA
MLRFWIDEPMQYNDFLDDTELKNYMQAINSRAKGLRKAGRITVAGLRNRIFDSGGKCEWCTISIVKQAFEVDHIISLGTGGKHEADNLAVACPDCNRAKASKHPAKFAQEVYARTGIITPLLQRVFDYYEVEATVQKSLFESEDEQPTITPHNDPADDPPPYIWTTH